MNKKLIVKKMNRKPRVAIVGVYPPPYGGDSVHIQRLRERLERKGFECIVYDFKKSVFKKNIESKKKVKCWPLYFLEKNYDIIHYHGIDLRLLLFFPFFCITKKKIVITIHSFKYNIKKISLLYKFMFWVASKIKIFFIVVNSQIKEKIISLGIRSENIKVINAFIPPIVREKDNKEINNETCVFIDDHSPIILANAYKISFYNNQDLYGIDMCIDMCVALKRFYPNIGVIFCLPDIRNYKYFEKMKQRIIYNGTGNNFLFITKQCQLYPIIMRSDVFVRPTNTDGYSISLAEAIYFGTPAVASDVCFRTQGTILFKNRDIKDFNSIVKGVLDNYEVEKAKLKNTKL